MFYTVINKMFPHSQFNIICIYAKTLITLAYYVCDVIVCLFCVLFPVVSQLFGGSFVLLFKGVCMFYDKCIINTDGFLLLIISFSFFYRIAQARNCVKSCGTTGKLYHPMFLSSDRYQKHWVVKFSGSAKVAIITYDASTRSSVMLTKNVCAV